MKRYLMRRIAEIVPTLFIMSIVVFSLMRVSGDDPVVIMLGPQATPELVAAVRAELHLDEPLTVQYVQWLGRALRTDLGRSLRTREPVIEMVRLRAPTTLYLAGATTVFAAVVGTAAGLVSALKRGRLADIILTAMSALSLALPPYLVALLLILVLGVHLRLLPIAAFSVDIAREPLVAMRNLTMPVVALGLGYAGITARMVRASVLDVLRADYVRTAVAKGLPRWKAVGKHALRNALAPMATLTGMNFVHLLGGAVIIEEIYGLPGVGTLLIRSIFERDFPVIQGVTLLVGTLFIVMSLAMDVLYVLLDPRIAYR